MPQLGKRTRRKIKLRERQQRRRTAKAKAERNAFEAFERLLQEES
jgi:hypothetical protein